MSLRSVMRGSRGDDRGPDPAPIPGHHKAIGFLSNTCLESLKNRKATKPAFNVLGYYRSGPF